MDGVNRVSVVSSVVDALRQEILSSMRPGDCLPNERALAARFSVGRNTVREAIILLEAHGLLEKTARGARVTDADRAFPSAFAAFNNGFDRSLETYRDLLEIRRHLELGILDRVLANVADADIVELDGILDGMARSLTPSEAAAADYDFHAKLVDIAGNMVLRRLYRVMGTTLAYYMEVGKSGRVAETVKRHRQIVDALRERSRSALDAAARRHFAFSEEVLSIEFSDGEAGRRSA